MTNWRKSSRSGTSGQSNCVEVANLSGDVGVRDSKDPSGPRITLPAARFRGLAADIKRGAHDLPWRQVGAGHVHHPSASEPDETAGGARVMYVEVGELVSGVGIRDSKDPDGGRLTVPGGQFGRLLQRIKAGSLDRP